MLHKVPVSQPSKSQATHYPGYDDDPGTIRYARVEVLKSGGDGYARVERLDNTPHVEPFSQQVRGALIVPGENQETGVLVNILLYSGSGVTAIAEALALWLQMQLPGTRVMGPFEGSARVVTTFGKGQDITTQTCPPTLGNPESLGEVRITVPFIILPGPGNLLILGQLTLREALGKLRLEGDGLQDQPSEMMKDAPLVANPTR